MNNPEYIKIGDKKYKINTDFRIAIECNRISMDDTIGDNERGLAIIYKLFGEKGLQNTQDHAKLIKGAIEFLKCGVEQKENNNEPDMDFIEDMNYIEASFMSDYNIDLEKTEMHWWKFYNLINGLSNSDMGNCCILNRIRNLRNYDTKDIKEPKELAKIKEAQKKVALKRNKKNNNTISEEQQRNIENFYKMTGINRKERF